MLLRKHRLCPLCLWALLMIISGLFGTVQSSHAAVIRVGVLAIESTDEPELAVRMQDLVVQELTRIDGYDVLSASDIRDALSVEKTKALLSEISDQRLANIAESLDANLLVSGALSRQNGVLSLTLRLMDAQAVKAVGRVTAELKDTGEKLTMQIADMVRKLLGAQGTLQLVNQVPGATVYLGDKKLGTTPLSKITVEKAGTYRLRILHDDYVPFEKTISVEPSTVTRVGASLLAYSQVEERSLRRRRVGWSLSAVALASASVAVWQYVDARGQRTDYIAATKSPVAAGQASAEQTRLAGMRDATQRTLIRSEIFALGAVGLAATGITLLVHNPWQTMLEASGTGPAQFWAYARPGGATVGVTYALGGRHDAR